MSVKSEAEETFWLQIIGQVGIARPERQFKFHPKRFWRFDFAWHGADVALEIEGGVHRIKDRFCRDVEKYNEAQLGGWVVLRATPEMVRNGDAIRLVERALGVTSKPRSEMSAKELRESYA